MPHGTPLHNAAKEGDIEVVNALLEKGADVNKKDNYRWTPLHYAANKGCIEVVKALLKVPEIYVNAVDQDGLTPLHFAAYSGNTDLVKILIAKGADVNALCELGTPLCLAALHNQTEIVNILFKNGAKVDCGNYRGKTPLHYAADKGHIEAVNALLETKKINVNAVDWNGQTPLHYAANKGCIEVVKALLKVPEIYVNAVDQDGLTPLHFAAYSGNTDLVKILIAKGANPLLNIKSYYYKGDSVTEEIKQLLKEAGEKINCSASKLFLAVFTNKKEEAESIIESSKKECNLAAILRSGSRIKYLFRSKEEAEELARKDNKDIIEEIWQKQERQAIFKGIVAGVGTGLLGGTIAIALFVSDVIKVEPLPKPATATIVAVCAIIVAASGFLTYARSKPQKPEPSTEMKGQNNVDKHVQEDKQNKTCDSLN